MILWKSMLSWRVLLTGLYYLRYIPLVETRPVSCAADKFADGCSVPTLMPAPFKHEFTPACDRHDICYACGRHYDWSRELCDLSFLNDMNIICERLIEKRSIFSALLQAFNQIGSKRSQCETAAKVYFEGVRLFAESHFDQQEHDYCLPKCAENHGSPRLNVTVPAGKAT